MSISSRIHDTLEDWQAEWKDRLRGWLTWVFKEGVEKTMDFLEPDLRAEIKPSLLRLRAIEGLPDDFRDLIDKTLEEPKAIHLVAIVPYLVGMLIGMGMGAAAPVARIGAYQIDSLVKSARIDPASWITALRREYPDFSKIEGDLKQQGWTEERIEALKFITLIYPSRQDLQRYVAKEALEPEAIAKYGLMAEFDRLDLSLFAQIGVPEETAKLDWIAHWEHASWMQVVEMLHRGLLSESEVWDWFRLVEIPPFWRDLLIQTAYTWPTRVDVRRWWDMRTITPERLRKLYEGMGYRGENLDDYVLWTKVYVAFPDLMARWSKGWISLDDVRSELTAIGMPAERLEEFIQMKVKAEQPERTAKERDITKTDIIKGVKTDVITRGEGEELLGDMGYSEDEAVYILEINIPRDEEDVVVKERELSKTDIKAGIAKEILSREEARVKLAALRYKPADVEFLLDIYEVVAKPPVELKLKEASKADIVLGVKKGLITQSEGYAMLLDLNFTPEASDFILMVKTEESPFSPINYPEFKELTHKYKIASGKEARPMTEELKAAADEVVRLTDEVKSLERSVEKEKRKLIKNEVVPEEQTKKLTALQVSLHRAESELARANSEYKSQRAEWRHG